MRPIVVPRWPGLAMHAEPSGAEQHAEMGFMEGWSFVLDQLVADVKAL